MATTTETIIQTAEGEADSSEAAERVSEDGSNGCCGEFSFPSRNKDGPKSRRPPRTSHRHSTVILSNCRPFKYRNTHRVCSIQMYLSKKHTCVLILVHVVYMYSTLYMCMHYTCTCTCISVTGTCTYMYVYIHVHVQIYFYICTMYIVYIHVHVYITVRSVHSL